MMVQDEILRNICLIVCFDDVDLIYNMYFRNVLCIMQRVRYHENTIRHRTMLSCTVGCWGEMQRILKHVYM